ncbi:MAG: efflux RND transporter periplasmic adaptor subunit [Acidobacteriota bacterium]
MKRTNILFGVIIAAAGLTGATQYLRGDGAGVQVNTAPLTRGVIIKTVSATGTLEAVTTVEVGTQVSGTVKELLADYNQIVKRGQVIARLEPSLFEAQVAQANASLERAQADLQRLQVARDDAAVKVARAQALETRKLIAAIDLEAAQVAVRSADAELASARASVTQARASLNQAQVNLGHTIIKAPIDGIVVSRNVDVGQTVAASMSAPTLFVLAADLTQMQVNASIDESDVGGVLPGQTVAFGVDAYPDRTFHGTVRQVRLDAKTDQNVVTYTAVISAANAQLLLKPGMTANLTIELARTGEVLTAPAAAVRFRPTTEMFAALGQAGQNAPAGKVVWVLSDGRLKAVNVRTGMSDGAHVEIMPTEASTLAEGIPVVTSAALRTASASGTATAGAQNPFVAAQPRPPGASGSRGSSSR